MVESSHNGKDIVISYNMAITRDKLAQRGLSDEAIAEAVNSLKAIENIEIAAEANVVADVFDCIIGFDLLVEESGKCEFEVVGEALGAKHNVGTSFAGDGGESGAGGRQHNVQETRESE